MARLGMADRRRFLAQSLGALGVGCMLPEFLRRNPVAAAEADGGHRVTVVLQFGGGHDALSALVPYGHKEYHEHRNHTRIKDEEVIKINDELGLHPNLKGWKEMLDEGAFAALPGLGYPNPNYSHFTACDIWFGGDPRSRRSVGGDAGLQTTDVVHGWVGRAIDHAFKGNPDPVLTLAIGGAWPATMPWAIAGGEHPGLVMSHPEGFRFVGDRNDERRVNLYKKLHEIKPMESSAQVDWVNGTAAAANAASEQIRRMSGDYKPKIEYPANNGLASQFRIIAGLIAGGLSTRVYWVHIGGFDTHSGQRAQHDSLMAAVNDATTAFFKDLKAQGQAQRVLMMTMSEFSRTTLENGSQGTDHSAGGAQFLLGPGVKPGIHGAHPSLKKEELIPTGWSLKHTQDFRGMYASVLEKWMGIPAEPILGQAFPMIDCIA
ncbi:MAG: DUF1501 domain-containing protein [Planctomycetes bacterium]|nr:DUF1501 domain-containing protein [Planctomycetota bacterium]